MTKLYRAACLFLSALLAAPLPLLADGFESDYDEKPWAEVEIQLPPFPKNENQISFTVGANSQTKYLIDRKSLSVGADDVIRFVLTVISASGARNISYEGMRCATAEHRYYASGRPDGTWSKARSNQWVKVRGTSNNHYVALYSDYFCASGGFSGTTAVELLRVLEQGGRGR